MIKHFEDSTVGHIVVLVLVRVLQLDFHSTYGAFDLSIAAISEPVLRADKGRHLVG